MAEMAEMDRGWPVMNLSRCLDTEGWLTELEASYLAKVASNSRVAIEVGSWMGRSTCAIAANIEDYVWAVDTWQGSPEHSSMLADKPPGWLYERFLENTKGLPVIPLMMPSVEAAAMLGAIGVGADMIFIDANHAYEYVKADIKAWMPMLADGGTLCGHDYDPLYWEGIVRAVNECVPAFRIVPGTTIWTTEPR